MVSYCIRISQGIVISPASNLLNPFLNQTRSNLRAFNTTSTMSSNSKMESASIPASAPGENYEPRQTHPSEDYTPDPSKSLPLSKERQSLVDDILDLYSCKPTVQKVKRYTSDCVYDDQFVYANDRYKMAGQWFALPKLFNESKTEKYQIVKNEPGLIQFRNEQVGLLLSSNTCPGHADLLARIVMDFQNHPQNRHHQRPRLPVSRPIYH